MKSAWIIQVGPKSNDKYSEKRRHREEKSKGSGYVKTEVEIRIMLPQAKEGRETPEIERGKERFSPKDFRGSMALPTP